MAAWTFFALLLASALALLSDHIAEDKQKYIIIFLGVVLILLAGFRNGESMPDYATYEGLYNIVRANGFVINIEVTFTIITMISNFLVEGNPIVLFVIYALIGVSLKLLGIKKLSLFPLYSILIYLSNYYILHEMIQIRVGIATGFILLSLKPLYDRKFKQFFLLILCSAFFHYSAIAAIFLWFLRPNTFPKPFYYFLLFLGYFLYIVGNNFFDYFMGIISFVPIQEKLEGYSSLASRTEFVINPFGVFAMTRLVINIFFSYFADVIQEKNKYCYLLVKMYFLALFCYVAFASYPEIAVRLSQLLMVVEILLLPNLIYTFKGFYLPRFLVIVYSFLAFFLNVFFTTYFSYS